MDSTPPSHRSEPRSQTKSASRLARIGNFNIENEESPNLSLDITPKKTRSASIHSLKSSNSLPLQELLLLSPSPLGRSKTRLADRLEMAEETAELSGSRRRCKSRGGQMGLLGCASPRINRRTRRRAEPESREERDFGLVEEIGKARKRRHSGRPKKEKLSLVLVAPSSSSSTKIDDCNQGNLDRIGQVIADLIMWKDVAKSTLWFGVGSLCFLTSCFAKGINFSIFAMISQIGLLILGASFFSNSIIQRNNIEKKEFKLKEDHILRLARTILPATNLAISKTREIFSGDPSTTLRVAPFLLVGAEYGHLITLWRLCALGFFISFTAPKLYSCYSIQINQKVECLKWRVLEAWAACSHKKIVAASAVTAFWNLTSFKTRIFAAFMSLVILRYSRQYSEAKLEEPEVGEAEEMQEEEEDPQQALIVAVKGSQK